MVKDHQENYDFSTAEVSRLRRLAGRVAEIAASEVNLERRRAWLALDAGSGDRPMILAEADAVRDSSFPLVDPPLRCESAAAREIERELSATVWKFEHLQYDRVVLAVWNHNWQVEDSGFGVKLDNYYSGAGEEARRGGYAWHPALTDFDRDFPRLRPRSFRVDRQATWRRQEQLHNLFGDILEVRVRGSFWWSAGLTMTAVRLVGMEKMMLMMYDHPRGLHRLMAFLRDDQLACIQWLEEEQLLSLNQENDYIGSGSCGYTGRLPAAGRSPDQPVRSSDLWVLAESQDTAGVGPEGFEEFVFQYQQPIIAPFGRCYYGCCEPLHDRIKIITRLANLEKVSVSAWSDQQQLADSLGRDYVFSRKPNPNLISGETFDRERIRRDLRTTMAIAGSCRLEIIMRTVITLNNQPERLAEWVAIARQETGLQ